MEQLNSAPYVSLNGVAFSSDMYFVRRSEETSRLRKLGHAVMFGVQVSEKTQLQNIENKYGNNWYPVGNRLKTAMHDVSPVIHLNTNHTDPFSVGMFAAHVYRQGFIAVTQDSDLDYDSRMTTENNIGGFQLNRLPWHTEQYQQLLASMQSTMQLSRLILQASDIQLESLTPKEFLQKLKPYNDHISGVLLDGSSGTGKPLLAHRLAPYIDVCQSLPKPIAIAIAGGLHSNSVKDLTSELVAKYPNLSFDAESGLRDNYNPNHPSKSKFSATKSKQFIDEIATLLSASKS